MKHLYSNSVSTLLAFALLLLSAQISKAGHDHSAHGQSARESSQPLFIANQGQWPERVRFRANVGSGAVFAENDRLTFAVVSAEDLEAAHELRHSTEREGLSDFPISAHAFALRLEGANLSSAAGEDFQHAHHHYFLGNDPAGWASNVAAFGAVRLPAVWPGIDLRLTAEGNSPKYEFLLAPGADPSQIRLRYEGLDDLSLQKGALVLQTSVGSITEQSPYAYQINAAGEHEAVACHFELRGEQIVFVLPEGYDATRSLVIDPVLVGSSYSGTSGTSQYGFTATFGPNNDIFGGGEAFGVGFPTSVGAYQTSFGGSVDMAITRFTPDASTVVFATYLGGSSSDLPHSLIADDAGDLIVMGTTSSTGFPTTPSAYDNTFGGGNDIVLAKLSPDGSTLLSSTFIGGNSNDGNNGDFSLTPNYGDQHRGEVNFDAAGNIIVASVSRSSDFPVSVTAFQNTLSGTQDAVVFSLSSDLSSLLWSTYLGGTAGDAGCALKADASGNIVVVGGTTSSNFPTSAAAWLTASSGGTSDGFMTKLNADGSALVASTYIGTSGVDIGYFVEVDVDGNIYAAGNAGTGFPISPGVYNNPGSTQFILKMLPDFSAPVWSTLVGAGTGGTFSPEMAPTAFLVDICGNVYLGGFTSESMPTTFDAIKPAVDPSGDFYFSVLAPDAALLLYATFFGGSGWEHVDGGTSRYSKNGIVYQASCTNSTDFPVTPTSAYGSSFAGWDRVVFAIDFEFAGVSAEFAAIGGTISGCAPFSVDFENFSTGADTYAWDFGTGATSTDFEPNYVFSDTGFYSVTLIASTADTSSSCNGADTAILLIEVHDRRIEAILDFVQDCAINTVDFSNLSNPPGSAEWTFGDGSGSSLADPSHVYTPGSSYTVTLTVTDSSTCNFSDVADTTLYAYPELVADFSVPPTACAPWEITATNLSTPGGADYEWDLGEGSSSTAADPTWILPLGGSYTVQLIANDPLTCNQSDTASIVVYAGFLPTADFETNITEPIPGSPIGFVDASVDAVDWLWDFGDGSTASTQNTTHTFTFPGTYTVCLTAISVDGCEDVFCRDVNVDQQVYVPNAFSPDNDGLNDAFSPISQYPLNNYSFEVFNRWGERVFFSNEPGTGWDGTYRGVAQEVGVYIYILRAAEIEGAAKGTVTLVR